MTHAQPITIFLANQPNNFYFIIPALVVFCLCIFIFFGKHALSSWSRGGWPLYMSYTKENLFEAYIALSALMVRKDKSDMAEKSEFIQSYFKKHFKHSYYAFQKSFIYSLRNPVQHKKVGLWLRKKAPEKDKIQLLYFLCGLAIQDGAFVRAEIITLEELTNMMAVPLEELRRIIAMYQSQHNEQREREQRRSSSSSTISISRKKEQSMEIIGITELTEDNLKKAYRKLTKIYHPDLFVNDSEEQQNLAHEKFSQITLAKDYLEGLL